MILLCGPVPTGFRKSSKRRLSLTKPDLERESERKCIATGAERPKGSLVRFVLGPDGTIVPDIRERLPGRGVWVSAQASAVRRAIDKKLFAKSLKRSVAVPEALLESTEQLLRRHALELLGLANKAGLVRAGFTKAASLIEAGGAVAVLEAADAARHGQEKIGRLARQAGIPVVCAFNAEELGLALGRGNVVHAALGVGRLSGRLLEEANRVSAFRDIHGPVSDKGGSAAA